MPQNLLYQRTIGSWWEADDESNDETIIFYKQKPYLHPSIMLKISTFLSATDLMKFRSICQSTVNLIDDETIVKRMVKDNGVIGALAKALYHNNEKYTCLIIDSYDVPQGTIKLGLLLSIMDHKNSVAKSLLSYCSLMPKYGDEVPVINLTHPCFNCFKNFLETVRVNSIGMLYVIDSAISSDNLEMYLYLTDQNHQYNLNFAANCKSFDIIDYLCKHTNAKMTQRIVYMSLSQMDRDELIRLIEYIPNAKKFTRRHLVTEMIEYLSYDTEIIQVYKYIDIMEKYASTKALKQFMAKAIDMGLTYVISGIINRSKRLYYSERFMTLVDGRESIGTRIPQMLHNKLRMQKHLSPRV